MNKRQLVNCVGSRMGGGNTLFYLSSTAIYMEKNINKKENNFALHRTRTSHAKVDLINDFTYARPLQWPLRSSDKIIN